MWSHTRVCRISFCIMISVVGFSAVCACAAERPTNESRGTTWTGTHFYPRVLLFAAHPDDETSMAGTIARFVAQDTHVFVCQMTDGSEGYPRPELRDKIADMRRAESKAADKVLGIERRYRLDRPDMGLVNDKATFKECIRIIREVRPDAIFTHGGSQHERHRDHKATYALAVEARWQAGNRVAAELGKPWKTPHLYLYGGLDDPDCKVTIDTSEFIEQRSPQ